MDFTYGGTAEAPDGKADVIDVKGEGAPLVLDVRNPGEREQKRIAASVHIPLAQLERRVGELPRDRRIAVHCAAGYRSSMAASLPARAGITDVEDLVGGLAAWEKAASLPVVSGPA